MAEAGRSSVQIVAQARVTEANIRVLVRKAAPKTVTTAGSRSYVTRARIAGTVTVFTARVGQDGNPESTRMSIVSARGAVLQDQPAVPSSAIGFVDVGQEVSLAIDAYPDQHARCG